MPHLLDTHTFLWWITDDPQLSPAARHVIANPEHEILFSAASAWELTIKAQLGRLALPRDPAAFVQRQVEANGFVPLAITLKHALHVGTLPHLHRDPFDRMLIAQVLVEGAPLFSGDRLVAQYPVRTLW